MSETEIPVAIHLRIEPPGGSITTIYGGTAVMCAGLARIDWTDDRKQVTCETCLHLMKRKSRTGETR
jgi:hypothetical protein